MDTGKELMMNVCCLEGNVGKNPEFFSDGKIARFSLATSKRDYKDKEKWLTTWHNIKVIGRAVDGCGQIRKGDKVVIAGGEICVDCREDDQGNRREYHYILVGIGGTIGVSKFKPEQPNKEEY